MGIFSYFSDKKDIEKVNNLLLKNSVLLDVLRTLNYDTYHNASSSAQLGYDDIPQTIYDHILEIDSIVENGSSGLSKRKFSFEGMSKPIHDINRAIYMESLNIQNRLQMQHYQDEFEIHCKYGQGR